MYVSFKTDPLSISGEPVDVDRHPHFTGLPPEHKNTAHFIMLFPNLFCFIYPHHIFSVIIRPIDAHTSEEKAILLVEKETYDDQWTNELWSFYYEVNREDIDICEQVQKGIQHSSPFTGGQLV